MKASKEVAERKRKAVQESLQFFSENKNELCEQFFSGLNRFQNLIYEKFSEKYQVNGIGGPVTSLVLGENEKTMTVMNQLRESGFDVRAIRPPTVPVGEALLRITHPISRNASDDLALVTCLEEILSE